MPEIIKEWILNIVSLIIFITVIEVIIPSGKFKKYIHLVTGTVVVIAIITPLTGLAGKDFSFPDIQLKNAVVIEKSEMEKQKGQMQESQARQVAAAYKKKLTDQIQLQVMQATGSKEKGDCQVEVVINEEYGSDTFGEIQKVKINLLQKPRPAEDAVEASAQASAKAKTEAHGNAGAAGGSTADSAVKSVRVDPIVIGQQNNKTQETKSRNEIDAKTGSMVKSKVSGLLNIEPGLILVNEQ